MSRSALDPRLRRAEASVRMTIIVANRELVDGYELARRLGVGRTTVWRLARTGRIPRYEIGRRWMFCEAECLDALRVANTPC